jgi:hypothetical protein
MQEHAVSVLQPHITFAHGTQSEAGADLSVSTRPAHAPSTPNAAVALALTGTRLCVEK